MRQLLAYAVAAVSMAAMPVSAQTHSDEPNAPFGAQYLPPHPDGSSAKPISIEVTRNGNFFWRGQIDGRGQIIAMYEDRPTVCDILFVTGTPSPPPLIEEPLPTQVHFQIYQTSRERENRFQLDFTYRYDVAAGHACQDGIDRRTLWTRFDFELREGESRVLPEYEGFELTVKRK